MRKVALKLLFFAFTLQISITHLHATVTKQCRRFPATRINHTL